MKTLTRFLIIFLATVIVTANAQITLQKTLPTSWDDGFFQSVYLKHSGFKFVYLNNKTLYFYNMNLSLFKTVPIPGNLILGNYSVGCISEGLFDTDTLHIDYMVTSNCCPYSVVIYKDNGAIVFSEDSASFVQYTPGMQGPNFFPIVPTDSGTYMILTQDVNSNSVATQVYKLPGSLPCIPGCLGSSTDAGLLPVRNNIGNMNIYPNPAVSYTNIYYTLPQGTTQGQLTLYDLAGRILKEYNVTSVVDHLHLTTSDIAAGTYFYQLSVNGNAIAAKKIIVVK